jgi:hypothetical protein
MVEAVIALGVGGVLAFLLAGPRAGRRVADQVPPADLPARTTRMRALPPAPLTAPPAPLDPAAAPHKATQTAQKFS